MVNLDGEVTYTPEPGFTGTDTFRYSIRDDDNATSNVANVSITVEQLGPPWQNPANPLDVNRDGLVVPFDALLVINEINERGSRSLPPPPLSEAPFSPPPFIDVSGDNFLSPIDALLVINFLNTMSAESEPAEGESASEADFVAGLDQPQLIGAALAIQPRTTFIESESVERAFVAESSPTPRFDEAHSLVRDFSVPPSKPASFDRGSAIEFDDLGSALDDDLLDLLANDLKKGIKK